MKPVLVLLVFGLAALASGQNRLANADEYELFLRARHEGSPSRQIEVLLEWENAYPNSEFLRERVSMLMFAYRGADRPVEALECAGKLLRFDPRDFNASYMIATLAVSLQTPSREQMRMIEAAAGNLFSQAAEVGRIATTGPRVATDTAAERPSDPETERVRALIMEQRRGKHLRTAADVENEIRMVAEKALAWLSRFSK
jgi:hypothetical protein